MVVAGYTFKNFKYLKALKKNVLLFIIYIYKFYNNSLLAKTRRPTKLETNSGGELNIYQRDKECKIVFGWIWRGNNLCCSFVG